MAVLHRLSIKNFRGIKDFDQVFGAGLTCIIGRGDSGKSTILDAINYTFSSSWGIHFNDSDFYNCDTNNPIIIEGTVTRVPEKLLSQYAAHVRGILPNGDIYHEDVIRLLTPLMEMLSSQERMKQFFTVIPRPLEMSRPSVQA